MLGVGGGSRAGCCAVGDCGGLREDIGCLWGYRGDMDLRGAARSLGGVLGLYGGYRGIFFSRGCGGIGVIWVCRGLWEELHGSMRGL